MDEIPRGPDICPITGRPFFMNLEHPELGTIATYGGPFDSYTIPSWDKEDEGVMRCERYDHDAGSWVEGGEPLPFHVVTSDEYVDLWERAQAPRDLHRGCGTDCVLPAGHLGDHQPPQSHREGGK